MKLTIVDPGKQHAGLAEYVNGVLLRCALVTGTDPYDVAFRASVWAGYDIDDLVCEGQQVYGRGQSDPNDLLPLAQTVGGCMARIKSRRREIVLPRIWTKGVPKPVRIRRWLQTASPGEIALVEALDLSKEQQHNVIDAICLGAWWLGRNRRSDEPN